MCGPNSCAAADAEPARPSSRALAHRLDARPARPHEHIGPSGRPGGVLTRATGGVALLQPRVPTCVMTVNACPGRWPNRDDEVAAIGRWR
eukprot:109726-Chlamydomonas_euryale.AAC.2